MLISAKSAAKLQKILHMTKYFCVFLAFLRKKQYFFEY